jgi:AAA+ ATPase superfamily predicted ATPase
MLDNPFTPSEIASHPEDFFGRGVELQLMERSLKQGSIAVRGAIGIGKSSLLARTCLAMEGFDSDHRSTSTFAVGHKDIHTVDDAAKLLLESFANVDETANKVKFKLGPVFEVESSEVCRHFAAGRHKASLESILQREYLDLLLRDKEYMILAVDEADKCPVPLARLIRALTTLIQQAGVKKVRFALAGVSPYFQEMVNEDPGLSRFFYKVLTLEPMSPSEATELVRTKLLLMIRDAERKHIRINLDPDIVSRVVDLSGGHPHILQLLGSHLVEHENDDPDGLIDAKDLVNSLTSICYEDRAYVYDSAIHALEIEDQLENLRSLLSIVHTGFPTRIDREEALRRVGKESLEWLMKNNYVTMRGSSTYGLTDEFLRIRMTMDAEDSDLSDVEIKMIEMGTGEDTRRELEFDPSDPNFGIKFCEPYEENDNMDDEQ